MTEQQQPVTLAGNYHVRLTTTERNEWSHYILRTDVWKDYACLEAETMARLAQMQGAGDNPTLLRAYLQCEADLDTASLRLADMARQWYRDLCDRRERDREQKAES